VIRFIAEGGMGEVYECDDRLLGERVALKTIRPEIATDHAVVERFRREIQLARRVTHKNVCRLFDVGVHRVPDGLGAEVDVAFLTMELLVGETLADYVRSAAPVAPAEALPLAEQMAQALAAAHDAGVVHRDFKSQNVVLVPSPSGSPRVVVTDFGLARGGAVPGADVVTGTGGIIGSPAYMAPEQVEGGPIGPAADLYALGVVLFELTTGTLPFHGDTPLATAVKRLRQPAPAPRALVPDLDPAWDAVIRRLMEREPTARFATAREVVAALRSHKLPAVVPPPLRRRIPVHRTVVSAALVVGGLIAGLVAARVGGVTSEGTAPPSPVAMSVAGGDLRLPRMPLLLELAQTGRDVASAFAPRPPRCGRDSVAVVGFKNMSGAADVAWMSAALAEMFSTELAATEELRTVPAESVGRMKRDLALTDAESYADDTLAQIRAYVCAEYVLVGSYLAEGSRGMAGLRLDLRVQHTGSGETVAQVSEVGQQAGLIDLVARAGGRLRAALSPTPGAASELPGATAADPGGQLADPRAALPKNPEAARLYAEGMVKLRREECADAQALLTRAVGSDPGFALAHSALAEALWCVGYEDAGRREAVRSLELADPLPRRERLLVQANAWTMLGEGEKALAAYRTLFEFFPSDPQVGMGLVRLQFDTRRLDDARATMRALRRLPAPDSEHPRLDIYDAKLARLGGDVAGERVALERAVTRAEARGGKLMAGAALMELLDLYIETGNLELAAATATKVHDIGTTYGDRELEAVGLDRSGTVLALRGHLRDAEAMHSDALEVVEAVGIDRRMNDVLLHLVYVQVAQGRLSAAERTLSAAAAAQDRIERKRPSPQPGKGGVPLAKKDDWRLTRLGLARRAATAHLLRMRGDLDGADRHYLALLEDLDRLQLGRVAEGPFRAALLEGRAAIARTRGQLDQARTLVNQARGAGAGVFFSLIIEATATLIELDLGHAAEAEAEAELLVIQAQKLGVTDVEAKARALHAAALAAQGKLDDARAALEPATTWAAASEDVAALVAVGLADGDLLARGSDADRELARRRLGMVADVARRAGLGALELEAQLALGEAELAAGHVSAGRARLERTEKLARQKGIGLIARRAADARS
jgi:serine/threonine protein kinase/TolB-like protein